LEPKIIGTVLPVLELSMQPGDKVFAESGELAWMSMAIQMQTEYLPHRESGTSSLVGNLLSGG
jgi:uncharacterized protein (AIM24 family)